jgi:1,4-alpha-glucan branching enzyme
MFYLPASFWADTIHLVGDFNNWETTATPLKLDDTCWNVTLELDADRAYEYRYLVNNTDWVNDWQADRFTSSESGGDNSVVVTLLEEAVSYTDVHKHMRQRPTLRVIQGGKQEKQAV